MLSVVIAWALCGQSVPAGRLSGRRARRCAASSREWIGQLPRPRVAETRILYGGSVVHWRHRGHHGQTGRGWRLDRRGEPRRGGIRIDRAAPPATHRSPPEVTLVFAVPEEGSSR